MTFVLLTVSLRSEAWLIAVSRPLMKIPALNTSVISLNAS